MNAATRFTGRTVKTVMSMVTMHLKVLMRLVSAATAFAGCMLFLRFVYRWRIAARVNVRRRCIFVYFPMHWRFNRAALCVGSTFHAVHGVLLNHVMGMMTVVVFTMHFVMFSHNLPLMLV
jgi:hypothetical protein